MPAPGKRGLLSHEGHAGPAGKGQGKCWLPCPPSCPTCSYLGPALGECLGHRRDKAGTLSPEHVVSQETLYRRGLTRTRDGSYRDGSVGWGTRLHHHFTPTPGYRCGD